MRRIAIMSAKLATNFSHDRKDRMQWNRRQIIIITDISTRGLATHIDTDF